MLVALLTSGRREFVHFRAGDHQLKYNLEKVLLDATEKKWLDYLKDMELETYDLEKQSESGQPQEPPESTGMARASDIYAHLFYTAYLIKGEPLTPKEDATPGEESAIWLKKVIEREKDEEGKTFRIRKEVFKAFIREPIEKADSAWDRLDREKIIGDRAALRFYNLLTSGNRERGEEIVDAIRQGEPIGKIIEILSRV